MFKSSLKSLISFISNHFDNNARLIAAAGAGYIEVVQDLLHSGADVNTQDIHGVTPLMVAIRNRHTEVAQILMGKGADVDVKDKFGNTALIVTAWRHNKEMAQALLDKGADINVQNNNNDTPLMVAVGWHDTEMVRLFLTKGANLNLQNNDDDTALILAAKRDYFAIVKMFHDHGVDISPVRDINLKHVAKEQEKIKVDELQALLEVKAKTKAAIKNLAESPAGYLSPLFEKALKETDESQAETINVTPACIIDRDFSL
ncbi:MAG: ankyrin repeat domain-containing protein [Pseudomonadota bacterium]